jgi:hypothetical protein
VDINREGETTMNEAVRDFHFNVNVRAKSGSKAQMANNEDSFLRAMEIQERKREKKELERIEEEKIAAAQAPVASPVPREEEAVAVPTVEAEAPVTETPPTEPAKPAAVAKKPAGGGVPGPKPRNDFSTDEKAVLLKRAKAHAAEVQARKK